MSKRVRGNFNPELIAGALRQGDNNVVQMFGGGAAVAGHQLVFDAGGNAIDGGSSGGAGSVGPDGTVQAADGAGGFEPAFLGLSVTPATNIGTENNALGTNALKSNVTGSSNVALGRNTLRDNTAGTYNIALGDSALSQVDDDSNIALGHQALESLITGSDNVAIGEQAGSSEDNAFSNVAVGARAGHHNVGSRNVFLGANAGDAATEDDKLYIDNTERPDPLIGGDFAARTIALNGAVKVSGVPLAASATTDTTNAANISSGTLPAARLPNPSASTLGGVESIAAVATKFVASISTAGVPVLGQPADADLALTNITTNDVSITKHGFAPVLPNNALQYLDGTGAYSVPAGSGIGITITAPGAGWTAFNTGSMVVTPAYASGRWEFTGNATAGFNVQGIAIALPSAPYVRKFRIWPLIPHVNYAVASVGLADGSVGTPGKLIQFGVLAQDSSVGSPNVISLDKCTSTTVFSASFAYATGLFPYTQVPAGAPIWLRITDDNTNWIFDVGFDGFTWLTYLTVARNTFLTATQLIVSVNSNGSNKSVKIVFDSFG